MKIGNQKTYVLESVISQECFVDNDTMPLSFSVKWVYIDNVEIVFVKNVSDELLNLSFDVILKVRNSTDELYICDFRVTIFNFDTEDFVLKNL